MRWTNGVKAYVALITLVGILFTLLPEALFANSWNPTLLVNTESFQSIDDSDTTTNIRLKFGDTIGETLTYDRTNRWFQFSRGMYVSGNIVGTGSIFVRGLMSGTTLYTRSNATIGGNLSVTGSIKTKGSISGTSLTIDGNGSFSGNLLVKNKITAKGAISGADETPAADTCDAALLAIGAFGTMRYCVPATGCSFHVSPPSS
jgi:hypothetical protein